jgi:hypothetical protein
MTAFTLLDDNQPHIFDAAVGGDAVRIPDDALSGALGWDLKPQGFCRDDLCYPVPPNSSVVTAEGVDLAAFATLIGRPLALDLEEGAGYLGTSGERRSAQLASLEAPDFTLPDLDGRMHSLSDERGKKVLLAAYGSW